MGPGAAGAGAADEAIVGGAGSGVHYAGLGPKRAAAATATEAVIPPPPNWLSSPSPRILVPAMLLPKLSSQPEPPLMMATPVTSLPMRRGYDAHAAQAVSFRKGNGKFRSGPAAEAPAAERWRRSPA